MRTILVSIQPKWLAKILRGAKNAEVRLTEPDTVPFKAYMYCSKGKEKLLHIIREGDDCYGTIQHGSPVFAKVPEDMYHYQRDRQSVVGEFVCNRVIHVTKDTLSEQIKSGELDGIRLGMIVKEFLDYIGDRTARIWVISDVKEYQRSKKLTDFHRPCPNRENYAEIKRPPQSWSYAEDQE